MAVRLAVSQPAARRPRSERVPPVKAPRRPAAEPRSTAGVADQVITALQHRADPAAALEGRVPMAGESSRIRRSPVAGLPVRPEPAVIRREEVVPTKKSKATDYDNTQYRVSGSKDNRLIEVIERRERDTGEPYYVAKGKVTGFVKKLPKVDYYDDEVDLGNWAPRVTHVNGMGVMPESGMTSASALLDSVRETIATSGSDVAIDPDAIDVLYTYSAQKSSFAGDLLDCLKGKVRVEDDVTESQEQLMLDAVAAKRRIHVSAHSRGTIKTDNAVRTVFKTLVSQYKGDMRNDPQVIKDANERAPELEATGLMDLGMATQIALEQMAEIAAEEKAKKEMDAYIQLVYGGNAVSYPTSILPVELFVGSSDFVSLGVGTYTKMGAKIASGNKRTKLHKQGGGHSYTSNYAKPVGKAIGEDLIKEDQG